MPIINRIADFQAEMAAWRQDLHRIRKPRSRSTAPPNWSRNGSNRSVSRSSAGLREPG